MNAIVKDIMTTYVAAARKTATFKEVATQLREQRVSAFPVIARPDGVVAVDARVKVAAQVPQDPFLRRLR